jgi:hypothetical protein
VGSQAPSSGNGLPFDEYHQPDGRHGEQNNQHGIAP